MRFNPKRLLPIIGITIFIVALWVLKNEVQHFQWDDIERHLLDLPGYRIFFAVCLTAMLYTVLTGYDYMGTRYAGSHIGYRKVALASFLGYAFSHNITPSLVMGASARFRVYSNHGLTPIQVTQIVGFCALSLWVGFLLIGSFVFLFLPLTIPDDLGMPFESLKVVGCIFLVILTTYIVASIKVKKTFRIGSKKFNLPSIHQVFGQISISSMDWIISAGILFMLLPLDSGIGFFLFLGMYMLSFMAGILSQVPGGLGVFETIMVLLMTPYMEADEVLSSLLVFRALYYFTPLLIASITLVIYETIQRRRKAIIKEESTII
ncbi:MAG: lysylphosphatidylglycerol synthase domain-containing protein [Balneolales bacterium]